ncbi:MAG: RHS repeat protein, partial [Elusimicrobia bacterium]|nr:RHS repeat protein [Elusimicrobiota bacterium]
MKRSLDRLVTKTLPEGAVSYQYDAAGNLTKVTNYNGSMVEMSYDSLNRLTQSKQTLPGG